MNHPTLTVANDPGSDNGQPGNFGADAWGMQLNYYNGDFDRTGSVFSSGHSSYLAPERELFNGNISSWASHIAHQEGTLQYEQLTGQKFHYDELNRLTRSKFHAHNGSWSFTQDYESDYTYDANGNILTLNRNAYASNTLGMDSMTYAYNSNTNQLNFVQDDVPAANYDVDIDNQQPDNYLYDAVGNLIKDEAEGIDAILWTVQGKVREVWKDNGDTLLFLYDGNGNRVIKEYRTANDTVVTYYTRDAQGNPMAIHERTRPDSMYEYRIKELPIYGSDRVGVYKPDLLYKRQAPEDCEGCCCCILSACYNKDMNWHSGKYTRNLGKRAYQIDDHLSNVRVTFSDVKHSTLDVNGLPDSVFADVISYSNYYGFGMLAVDRHHSVDSFRWNFNSQEKIDEIKGRGKHYTAKYWEYDPRTTIRWNVDPLFKKYAHQSPYVTYNNNPIFFVDIKGLQGESVTVTHEKVIEEGEGGEVEIMRTTHTFTPTEKGIEVKTTKEHIYQGPDMVREPGTEEVLKTQTEERFIEGEFNIETGALIAKMDLQIKFIPFKPKVAKHHLTSDKREDIKNKMHLANEALKTSSASEVQIIGHTGSEWGENNPYYERAGERTSTQLAKARAEKVKKNYINKNFQNDPRVTTHVAPEVKVVAVTVEFTLPIQPPER